jgi:hypothetical protein
VISGREEVECGGKLYHLVKYTDLSFMPALDSLQCPYLVSRRWSTLTPSFGIGSLAIGAPISSVDCCDLSRLFGFLIPGRLPRRP